MDPLTPITRLEIRHGDYNLDRYDNLDGLPEEGAVFGIFAIINEQPVNCRYINATLNLRREIRRLYELPPGEGLRKFMQGPWIQMLVFELIPGPDQAGRDAAVAEWTRRYTPAIDEEGEYPLHNPSYRTVPNQNLSENDTDKIHS